MSPPRPDLDELVRREKAKHGAGVARAVEILGQASPMLYGEMVAEDRRIRLAGYEVYRFGGAELKDPDVARPLLRQFFLDLVRQARHRHETHRR